MRIMNRIKKTVGRGGSISQQRNRWMPDDFVTKTEDVDGKSCTRVDAEDLVTAGIEEDIFGFGIDINGCSNLRQLWSY
ncbi:hypothetical protein TNCV_2943231 [Trichonephila clavipes]|nr:hypothetical protein TNCV_2943231 [Trichonephila clavipes]